MIRIPEARWAGPEDSEWDLYYNDYEIWVNENYDMKYQKIAGRHMTFEQACEDDDLFGEFVEWWTDRTL